MKYLLLFFICSISTVLSAQQLVISADKMNKVYVGRYNRLTVVSGNCGCDALAVTADKGTITKIEGCTYSYTPSQPGNAELSIFENKGGKATLIGKNTLRVKTIPLSVVLDGKSSGIYPVNKFKMQLGIKVQSEDPEFDVSDYKVTEFTFVFVGKDRSEMVQVKGALFNIACQKIISGLQPGDRIVLENIHVSNSSDTALPINSMAFTMK